MTITAIQQSKIEKILTGMRPGDLTFLPGFQIQCCGPRLYKMNHKSTIYNIGDAVSKISASMASKTQKRARGNKRTVTRTCPDRVKGISVGGAYAYLLCTGLQAYESRTVRTHHRGWTFVQCPTSKQWDESFRESGISPSLCPKSSLIGAIEISDCTYDKEYNLYYYHISGALLFPKPIMGAKGHRTPIWTPNDETTIKAFNQGWKILDRAIKDERNNHSTD